MNKNNINFTIMIIDDEENILSSMSKYLKTVTKHRIISCSDALEAVEIIKNVTVDIIFSDINMPDLSGLELLKIIKSLPEGNNIDVVIMTGYSTKENAINALKNGAVEYLEKPFSFDEIMFVLNKLIENRIIKQENLLLKEMDDENKWFLKIMSVISHELKTPLTIISGNTSIMLEQILGSINEKQRKSLIAINNGCSRLTRIIDSYFDYKKINAENIESQKINYKKCIIKFMDYLIPELKKRRPHIDLSYKIDLDNEIVLIEPVKTIEIVLKELITNSCRNTKSGEITVNIYKLNNNIYTEVTDNGNGIAEQFCENIFHPGKSGKKDTLHSSILNNPYEYGKSGYYIGLAKAKKYLSFLKGTIYFNSIPSEKTIFTYTLPIIPQ